VKKASQRTGNGGKTSRSLNRQGADQSADVPIAARASLQFANGKPVLAVVAAIIGLAFLAAPSAQAQNAPNLGSPPFANPSEIRYRPSEHRLRGVIELISGQYLIPNVGTETLRQFRGWDPAQGRPDFNKDTAVAPGPTLRVRLGDLVEISFLNKIDDSKFAYTFDTHSPPGVSSFGCDQSGTTYPGKDIFPNCFHGSSTANIHFHGTHTSPDGVSDNVLVQILPQLDQPDWTNTFSKIFDSGKIPQTWADLPENYRNYQEKMIKQHDKNAAAQAKKNNLPPPESLWDADKKMIDGGQWPQYLIGAFPNFFEVPDYSSGKFKAGQAPGTHWYHAHKHGSTSLHILNGLAGAIIIESNQEGGYDQVIRKFYGWGDTYGNHEKIIVFQQLDTTQNLERAGPGGKGIKQVLINGKLKPTITMQPGEVQLWRLVNATEGNNQGVISPTVFQTEGFTFKQTAQDGVQFSPTNYQNQPFLNGKVPAGGLAQPGGLVLAGANRADLLVQAPTTPGVYAFVNGKPTATNQPPTLFFVEVTKGPAVNLPNGAFPTAWAEMPKFLNDLPPPGPNDIPNPDSPVKFQWEPGRVKANRNPDPPHYMINDHQFGNPPKVDQCMPLNGLQDWVLENDTTVAHPFHIHINPFQVVEIDTPSLKDSTKPPDDNNIQYSVYKPTDNFIWQDVIALPLAVMSSDGKQIWPGKITIRQTYLDFTGTYVLHCHILAHEDRGMMELVRVVPAADYPKKCQDYVPEHH
jgi:FtsP/CotA-like multicopper oxidase with cupredoxin domain